MNRPYKPDGYPSVSAYVMVDGAQRVIDFLKKTFNATELRRFDGPEGKISHVEVRIEDSVVMLSDGGGSFPAFPAWLHVYVPDVDATYQRALAAGATSMSEPANQSYGDRTGAVSDAFGNQWYIATPVRG